MSGIISRISTLAVVAIAFLIGPAARAGSEPRASHLPIRVASSPGETTVTVASGDHLWKISAHHLERILDRPAEDREVSPYWRVVIDANIEGLRSGNPDLIYPGEIVVLPSGQQ